MNALERDLNKNALERVLQYECIGKGLTIRMHWKGFYYMDVLERVLLYECIGKGFTIRIHWKGFYYMNSLERDLQ